ncbi:uncharacterized protein N7477_005655 [Penicillium maclennaniae]|uniref:uncharacterized protein n=1 Tax=Penicillium maclennaniae TaxID=1343394 RepID=UPI00254196A0|nr:uncharacterized protein N7477_005655 [Penicillium maclennaniae]KAJ5670292.1 hypothetical protein N7477_005655 [Penicillium maclennaniae]
MLSQNQSMSLFIIQVHQDSASHNLISAFLLYYQPVQLFHDFIHNTTTYRRSLNWPPVSASDPSHRLRAAPTQKTPLGAKEEFATKVNPDIVKRNSGWGPRPAEDIDLRRHALRLQWQIQMTTINRDLDSAWGHKLCDDILQYTYFKWRTLKNRSSFAERLYRAWLGYDGAEEVSDLWS